MHKIGVILLAGGAGIRMRSSTPKQFLMLHGKPVTMHSFEILSEMPEVREIVIVCPPAYRELFYSPRADLTLQFAKPGSRRQDSVYNGLQMLSSECEYICVHDSVRPFISIPMVRKVLTAAYEHGASALGMPMKFTIKECCPQGFVKQTPDRSTYWEIQTPQVIEKQLFHDAFQFAMQNNINVTDDVSLVELLGKTVRIVEGSYHNIKITTKEDLLFSESLLSCQL